MSDYLSKKFNVFINDKCLKEEILDKYPMPSTECIKAQGSCEISGWSSGLSS